MDPLTKDHCEMPVDDIEDDPRDELDEDEPRETARDRWLDGVDSGTNREYL